MQLSDPDWAYVDERARDFTGREWVFERIRSFLASDLRMLVVVAPPGTGKTAIAARLAQASAGHLPDEAPSSVPAGTIDAAVFCRAGQVSLLGVAQDLADQLSTLPGFAEEQRQTVARSASISDIHARAEEVHPGGTLIGVKVDLARLGPEHAFADGLALPLRRLGDKPGRRPPVLLVDSLDEAYASAVAQSVPSELAGLVGVRLIVTTRDDPRVLAQLGDLDGALTAGRATVVHLIDDAPAAIDDVRDFAAGRLRGRGSDEAIAILAERIGAAADRNFLYAHHVVNGLLASPAFADLDVPMARALDLPADGLAGVYGDFLRRVVGPDPDRVRWRMLVRPVLAPIALGLGDGFDTTQLAAIGSVLAGQHLSSTNAGDVTEDLGQLLEGSRPDGPFRVYHQSFADFLLDPEQKYGWRVDAGETHAAIVEALTPRRADETTDWSAADTYARTHLAAHAVACGRLDGLLTDPGFLVVADVDRLQPLLWNASSVEAMEVASVVQLASLNIRGRSADERVSYLELAARMRGADAVADRIAAVRPDRPWSVSCARWHQPAVHVPLRGHIYPVMSIAFGQVDGRPVAVSAGIDRTVRVWDLRTLAPLAEPLAGHSETVRSVAIGLVDELPVAVSGDDDGIIRIWDLRRLAPLGEPLTGHTGGVSSVAVGMIDDQPVAVIGCDDGIVRLWNLRSLTPLDSSLRGHEGPVSSVVVGLVDGRPVAVSGGADRTVRVWDLRTLAPLGEPLIGEEFWVRSVAIGLIDDRPVAVSGGADGSLRVWDIRTFTLVGEPVTGHVGWVYSVAVGHVGDLPLAISGGDDGNVRVWDLRRQELLGALSGHESHVSSVAVGHVDDLPVAISGGDDDTVRVWDLRNLASRDAPRAGHTASVSALAVGRLDDRHVVVSGDDYGEVRVWDLRNLAPIGEPLTLHEGQILSVAVGVVDDRPIAVTSGFHDGVRVWDLRTRAPLGELLTGPETAVYSVAIGQVDGRPIAVSGGGDGTVRVWDLRTLAPLGNAFSGHKGDVNSVAVGRVDDRPVAVSGGNDGTVRVWDLRTLTRRAAPRRGAPRWGHQGSWVRSVAIGLIDDVPVAISGASDGTLRVWDLRTRAPLGKPLTGHESWIDSVAVGRVDDRPVVISGSTLDGTVRVWDLRTRSQIALVSVPTVSGLAIAGPDRIVVSAAPGLLVIRFNGLQPG